MTDVSHETSRSEAMDKKSRNGRKIKVMKKEWKGRDKKFEIVAKGKIKELRSSILHYPGGWQTQPSRGAQRHHWSRLALVDRERNTRPEIY
ncbi:hypothetical protein N7451_000878 [Penicillium sp. IBT 35674x]|nr:hypothetical protein N7451_000878 [Penicillium sp. IBT 35674x]